MASSEQTKLKFRVTAREGSARKWSEKWGVTLSPNEEFHVTDQLLKLPFTERQPVTICVFSVPEGELKFRVTATDKTVTMNGIQRTDGVMGPGDKLEIAGIITIEAVTAPAKKLNAAERDGPSLEFEKPDSEAPTRKTPAPFRVNKNRDIPVTTSSDIPPVPRDEEGPTLTLSPLELEQELASRLKAPSKVDRRAHAFATPAFGMPLAAREPEKPIELENRASRDEGINPDRLSESNIDFRKPPKAREKPASEELKSRVLGGPASGVLRKPDLNPAPTAEESTTLHQQDLDPAIDTLPTETDIARKETQEMPVPVPMPVEIEEPTEATRPSTQTASEKILEEATRTAKVSEAMMSALTEEIARPEPAPVAAPVPAPAAAAPAAPVGVITSTDLTGMTRFVPMRAPAPVAPAAPVEPVVVAAVAAAAPAAAPAAAAASVTPAAPVAPAAPATTVIAAAPLPPDALLEDEPETDAVAAPPPGNDPVFSMNDPLLAGAEDPPGQRLKQRALVFGGSAGATLLVITALWTIFNRSSSSSPEATANESSPSVQTPARDDSPLRIEPLQPGIPIEELRRKVELLKSRTKGKT